MEEPALCSVGLYGLTPLRTSTGENLQLLLTIGGHQEEGEMKGSEQQKILRGTHSWLKNWSTASGVQTMAALLSKHSSLFHYILLIITIAHLSSQAALAIVENVKKDMLLPRRACCIRRWIRAQWEMWEALACMVLDCPFALQ